MRHVLRVASGVLLCACTQYTSGAPPDARSDGGAELPRDAAADVQDAASVLVPPFEPSFDGDAGPGDITVGISGSCVPPPSPRGGAMSGSYTYASACFSRETFIATFESFCPGITVDGSNAVARVNGAITVVDPTHIQRTGRLWIAAQVIAPCKGSGTCAQFGELVRTLLERDGEQQATNVCYETGVNTCTCKAEVIDTFSEKILEVDAAEGTWGDRFTYGFEGAKLTYSGIATDDVSVEPAMVWSLIP